MKRIVRLVWYLRPYTGYALLSVALTTVVAAMAAFRMLLIKPIFDNVLSPDARGGGAVALSCDVLE